MRIILEHREGQDLEVVLRGDTQGEEAMRILSVLNQPSSSGKLMLEEDDESILVSPDDILYFESSQGKTTAVTGSGRYEAREKLYELAESLRSKGFLQINKSTVVNVNHVKSISAEFSGNYAARLKDREETLIISRKYIQSFKEFVRR